MLVKDIIMKIFRYKNIIGHGKQQIKDITNEMTRRNEERPKMETTAK